MEIAAEQVEQNEAVQETLSSLSQQYDMSQGELSEAKKRNAQQSRLETIRIKRIANVEFDPSNKAVFEHGHQLRKIKPVQDALLEACLPPKGVGGQRSASVEKCIVVIKQLIADWLEVTGENSRLVEMLLMSSKNEFEQLMESLNESKQLFIHMEKG